ncbi:MAG: PAS domain-containing sensor histidine kinase [Anaerovorax sp.]
MQLSIVIISFVVFTLLVSFFYFHLSSKNKERYTKFWGLAWISYSFSLLFLILSISYGSLPLLEFRKIFDMYNILFLLFGAYTFMHLQIPSFWYRFSLYLSIWLCIGAYYRFDVISIYIPIAFFQIIATVILCYTIYRYWQLSVFGKALSIVVFTLWGLGKSMLSFAELYYNDVLLLYLSEIVFSNLLCFCIFIIYLQKVQNQSASGEKLYHMIAENAADVIFYYSLKPRPAFTYITPSVESLTGYAAAEFYRDPKFYLNIADPSDFHVITSIFNGIDSGNTTQIVKLLTKDSGTRWAEFHNKLVYEDGTPVAIESFVRDITLMKDAEEQLITSKQSRDLLLSYISHELKTPVSSILGYVNGMLDGIIVDEEEKKHALQIISSKTMTLERLIEDLFLLSKLETNKFSFTFTEISAEELCRSIVDKNIFDIESSQIQTELLVDWSELSDIFVIADTVRINQVFSNIVYNAIKYTAIGGTITIRFYLDPDNNFLCTDISDTGSGIPSKDLPFIFDRFFKSVSPASPLQPTGSGLGLTLSKQIIEGHGGQIHASSILNQGSIFTFSIPIFTE